MKCFDSDRETSTVLCARLLVSTCVACDIKRYIENRDCNHLKAKQISIKNTKMNGLKQAITVFPQNFYQIRFNIVNIKNFCCFDNVFLLLYHVCVCVCVRCQNDRNGINLTCRLIFGGVRGERLNPFSFIRVPMRIFVFVTSKLLVFSI